MPTNLEVSIEINAAPDKVWATVSDLTQMPKWSPQTRKVIVRGGQLGQGSKMVNVNKLGWRVWPTQSMVTAFEPGRKIAWRVKENHATWSFDLEPLDGGTRTKLIERRDVSGGTTAVSQQLIDKLMGGEDSFEKGLTSGMRQTLQRIRSQVESA
ncbi:SRPBCC family protein [Flexivirga sp. ID2601S]|uniref:SRPBCC family protein n=1 Tax=Flexivirga aerilata TaxID=1656889 RepID=A0A849AIA5_9MICO|nr:SRPBCC family protein [Flexivirga aerilata]NNG39663.1 SRPBCC family protein [Flexivirga aerilata]